jgi:hypothetical protein
MKNKLHKIIIPMLFIALVSQTASAQLGAVTTKAPVANEVLDLEVVALKDSALLSKEGEEGKQALITLVDAALVVAEDDDEGVAAIATPSGIGLVSIGRAYYANEASNPDANRENQRAAVVEAIFNAKTALAKKLYGFDLEAKSSLASFSDRYVVDKDTLMKMDKSQQEDIETSVRAILLGAVIYKFVDHGGEIVASLVTSPATRGKCSTGSTSRVMHASDYEAAMTYIKELLKDGHAPTSGGMRVLLEDGSVAWIGFGSATSSQTISDKELQYEDRKAARTTAQSLASKNLLALIKGENIVYDDKVNLEYQKSITNYEDILDENGGESMKKLAATEKKMLSSRGVGTRIESEVKGKLPPGCDPIRIPTTDPYWHTYACVWYPSLSAEVLKAQLEMGEGGALANTPDAPADGYELNPDGSPARDADGKMRRVAPLPKFDGERKNY